MANVVCVDVFVCGHVWHISTFTFAALNCAVRMHKLTVGNMPSVMGCNMHMYSICRRDGMNVYWNTFKLRNYVSHRIVFASVTCCKPGRVQTHAFNCSNQIGIIQLSFIMLLCACVFDHYSVSLIIHLFDSTSYSSSCLSRRQLIICCVVAQVYHSVCFSDHCITQGMRFGVLALVLERICCRRLSAVDLPVNRSSCNARSGWSSASYVSNSIV